MFRPSIQRQGDQPALIKAWAWVQRCPGSKEGFGLLTLHLLLHWISLRLGASFQHGLLGTVFSLSNSGTLALLVQEETQGPGKGNKRLAIILPVKAKLKWLGSSVEWDYWESEDYLVSVKERRRGSWPQVLAGTLTEPMRKNFQLLKIYSDCLLYTSDAADE